MFQIRQARSTDRDGMLELIARGFSKRSAELDPVEGEEHRTLFRYLYSLPDWRWEQAIVAETDGRLAAAVGFFSQILSFESVAIPIWAISPVVTDPDFRGFSLASQCLTMGIATFQQQGIPGVFLWGLPDYYPKFGFVPLLPRYRTRIIMERWRPLHPPALAAGKFRTIHEDDLRQIGELYDTANPGRWLQPLRNQQWWRHRFDEFDIDSAELREVPFPHIQNFWVWETTPGIIAGYLYFREENNRRRIIITEAAATGYEIASAMLHAFLIAKGKSFQEVTILGTPQHWLNYAAYHQGGTHLNPAPRAGMIRIGDWDSFLQQLRPVLQQRWERSGGYRAQNQFQFHFKTEPLSLTIETTPRWRISLTGPPVQPETAIRLHRLVFGFYDWRDLEQIDGDVAMIPVFFPEQAPFIWDANYLY